MIAEIPKMKVRTERTARRLALLAWLVMWLQGGLLGAQPSPPAGPEDPEKVATLLDGLREEAARTGSNDPFLVAVLKHSNVAVPILGDWLRMGAPTHSLTEQEEELVADALAYIATSEAIQVIGSLAEDRKALAPLVQRCLTYSIGRGNPFRLAYTAVEIGPTTQNEVGAWIASVTAEGQGSEEWALAIAERVSQRKEEWEPARDPLVRLLPGAQLPARLVAELESRGIRRREKPPA